MLTLAIDSSAKAASAAVIEDNKILGEYFINTKQTHSETLMPMIENVLKLTKKKIDDFDLLAVSNGPGSFTGIRIAVSCVKGLAFDKNVKCIGISTLESIAYGAVMYEGKTICAVMDARCEQVYNAIFRIKDGIPERLCEDRAIKIEELYDECKSLGSDLVLIGDGAELCFESFRELGVELVSENIRQQRASSVAFAANRHYENSESISGDELVPTYLRISQAERELKKKNGGKS